MRYFHKGIMRILFLLLVFFSNLTLWKINSNITGFNVFMVLFVIFLVLSIYDFKRLYGLHRNIKVFIPLIIFFSWWFLRSLYTNNSILFYNKELWQWILLFIIFTNFISQDIWLGYIALIGYLLSAMLFLFFYYFGNNVYYELGRLGVFEGINPNTAGNIISISLIIIFFFVSEDLLSIGKIRFIILSAVPGLFFLMIETGSRGALIYLIVGIFFYLLLSQIRLKWKIVIIFLMILISISIISYLSTSEVFQNRWVYSDISQIGGRKYLWTIGFKLFLEKPIIGHGDGGLWSVMNEDPHNLYLVTLITSGIVGFLFFCVFLVNIARKTITNIKYHKNAFCFVLFIITLVDFMKSGGAINSMQTWIRLSIIVGLSTAINNEVLKNDFKSDNNYSKN